jgi:hypothetical protein
MVSSLYYLTTTGKKALRHTNWPCTDRCTHFVAREKSRTSCLGLLAGTDQALVSSVY